MKKSAIPTVRAAQPDINQAHAAIKQNLDQITGLHPGAKPVPLLKPDATLAQVISAINIIAERLN